MLSNRLCFKAIYGKPAAAYAGLFTYDFALPVPASVFCSTRTAQILGFGSLEKHNTMLQVEQNSAESANSLSSDQKKEYRDAMILLREYRTLCAKEQEQKKQFPLIKKRFDTQAKKHQSRVKEVQ